MLEQDKPTAAARTGGAPQLAIVLVHRGASDRVRRAVQALRGDLEGSGLVVEWVAVAAAEGGDAELLRSMGLEVVTADRTTGHGAAAHLGLVRTSAPHVLVLRSDVVVQQGCVPALLAALDEGAAVAGPKFWWDDDRTLLLPPPAARGFRPEAIAGLGRTFGRLGTTARRRWRTGARRHWLAGEVARSSELSAGLLAFAPSMREHFCDLAESLPSSYDATPLVAALEQAGAKAVHVPAAEAIDPRLASNAVAGERWALGEPHGSAPEGYGWASDRLLRFIEGMDSRTPAPPELSFEAESGPTLWIGKDRVTGADGSDAWRGAAVEGVRWIEVGAGAHGFPAAGQFVGGEGMPRTRLWQLPPDVWRELAPGSYSIQAVDAAGRDLRRWSFQVQPRD